MSKKRPCALLVNDLHINKETITDFQKNWDEALDICHKRCIDTIIIGGDLWTTRSSQSLDVLLGVKNAIIKAASQSITLIIAEGNHDLVDQESFAGYSHLFSEYNNVIIVDDFITLEFGDDVTLYVMSYFPEDGSFTERYNKMLDENYEDSRYNVLYIHEGINGAIKNSNGKELPASMFNDFNAVLVGHYHDRCSIPNTNIEYIGASRQHNFGENEEKGYTVFYEDGTYEFVKNKVNIRYQTIDVNANELGSQLYHELKDIDPQYKIKVRISCDPSEASTIDKQKIIDCGVSKVEIVSEDNISVEAAEALSLEQKFDKAGLQKEYSVFCNTKCINDEMGLNYLSKIR